MARQDRIFFFPVLELPPAKFRQNSIATETMSEPLTEPENSRISNFIQGLFQRSFELEMLVSGVMILLLLRVPDALKSQEYINYLYFPKITKQYDVRYYHYENHLPTGEYNFTPTIQSDIINDKYIRLFIPHRPIDDDSLAAKFPGLAPFRVGGLGFESSKPESLDDVAKSLGALKEFYLVTLNDSALVGASYSFYTHPKSTMRGLMIYIPVDGLPKGRHLLIVRQPFTQFKRDYFIPFYI